MRGKFPADYLVQPRSKSRSINCMGDALHRGRLTTRRGRIVPGRVEEYGFLQETTLESAEFVVEVAGDGVIAHMAYIDQSDSDYVWEEHGRRPMSEAMRPYRNWSSGGFTERYLKVREGVRKENPS